MQAEYFSLAEILVYACWRGLPDPVRLTAVDQIDAYSGPQQGIQLNLRLLDILHLFTHLLDQHLQVYTGARSLHM
jgi:hypothetical protein